MYNLGTDSNSKKITPITKTFNQPIQRISTKYIHLPQPLPKTNPKKKNLNLQSIHFLSNDLANNRIRQNHKENSIPEKKQPQRRQQDNRQIITSKVPFANATNTKPGKSYSINSTKPKAQNERQLGQKQYIQNPKSPKINQRSKAFCEKLCQQKLLGITDSNKKRTQTYRIHLSSSSKDKENNINTHNRVNSISQQRQLFVVENLQHSQQKSQSSPAIDEDLARKLTSNRQKSSLSFMIRKKINSTVLQSQQRNCKESNNAIHWSKSYRKDKYTKDEILQISATPKHIEQRAEAQVPTKTYVRQQIAQQQTSKNLQIQQNQKSHRKLDMIKAGKSLKMRKNKFTKPQQDKFVYDEIFTEPSNKEKLEDNLNMKFQKSLEGNLELKKVHTVEYQRKKMQEVQSVYLRMNTEEDEKKAERSDEGNDEPQLYQINALYEMACQYLPFKPIENELILPPQQGQLLLTKNIKVCKKRVSSIRALKNLYRNIQAQEKSQLAESRNIEQSKKKQKQTSCLTHKIKWGNQSRRRESQEEKINEFIGNVGVEWQFKLEIQSIHVQKRDFGQINKKKARFMDEQVQVDQMGIQFVKKNSIEKRPQVYGSQISYSSKPFQTIGSRSMIIFQDPGISVIVKKNSSLQSSAYVYTTIEQDLQKSENSSPSKNQQTTSKKRRNYLDNPRLQSLKELFLELKSNKSIQLEERS